LTVEEADYAAGGAVVEAKLVSQYVIRETARQYALAKYGITEFALYTRDVVEALPGAFNSLWTRMKGIIP